MANNVEEYMNKLSEKNVVNKRSLEFEKYSNLYKQKFGKDAYIAEPNGTEQQTIEAIKKCIEKDEDILDELLYGIDENKNVMF